MGCLCTAMALAGSPAIGQTAADPTWDQALEAAWQRAKERIEGAVQLQRAQAQQSTAESLWAAPPSIGLGYRAAGAGSNGRASETELGVSVPLWLPGQKQSRLDSAQADAAAARLAADAQRQRLAGELRQSALQVGSAEAELRQAEAEVALLKSLADDVERRVRAGDLARADALAANADRLAAQAARQAVAQQLLRARERWQLLTGMALIPPGPMTVTAVPQQHPELAAAAALVERARRRLDIADRSRRDPPELGVHMRREADNTGSVNSLGVSLRVPFATAGRNLPLLVAAQGELDIALLEEQRVQERLALEAQSARLQIEGAGEQLQAERERAGLLRQRAQLIERSFAAGESPLPELLRARAAVTQSDTAVLRQQSNLDQARARLSQATGVFP